MGEGGPRRGPDRAPPGQAKEHPPARAHLTPPGAGGGGATWQFQHVTVTRA
jgi:hypothetical protein